MKRGGYALGVDGGSADRLHGDGLSALGFHVWAAEHYRRLAEKARREQRPGDAAAYRELAELELRLGETDHSRQLDA